MLYIHKYDGKDILAYGCCSLTNQRKVITDNVCAYPYHI